MNRYLPPQAMGPGAQVVRLPAQAMSPGVPQRVQAPDPRMIAVAPPPVDPLLALVGEMRGVRQDLSRMMALALRANGGDNPFGYAPRPATVYEHGVGHSGPSTVVDGSGAKQILNVALKEIVPQGYYGMATVHISAKTEEVITPGPGEVPNSVLIGHIHWQNGDAGGDEDVDLTRGAIVPVGATTALVIEAELVSARADEDLVLFSTVRVEAGVSWETSSDKDPPMSLPGVVLEPNVDSPFFPIPLQARSMLALGAPGTAYPTLVATFTTTQSRASTLYDVPDPFRNGGPIRNGANFVIFANTVHMDLVFPTFDLF